jgi:hypothetical protein
VVAVSNGNPLDLVLSVHDQHIATPRPDCTPPRIICSCRWAILARTIEEAERRHENHIRAEIEKARTEITPAPRMARGTAFRATPYPNGHCPNCGAETTFLLRQMTYTTVHAIDCDRPL